MLRCLDKLNICVSRPGVSWMSTKFNSRKSHEDSWRQLSLEERKAHGRKKQREELASIKLSQKEILRDVEAYENATAEFIERVTNSPKSVDSELQQIKQLKSEAFKNRMKTIRGKFFKPPPEKCLLTYDAKEQIRYLHKEFPEEWTVGRLADSFPASKRAIAQIIRSPPLCRSLNEIVKHDMDVKRNWEELTEPENDRPFSNRYAAMVRNRRLHLLAAAAGNLSLPTPTSNQIDRSFKKPELKRKGSFSKIIESYLEIQKKKEIEGKAKSLEEAQAMYDAFKKLNLQTLQSVLKNLPDLPRSRTARTNEVRSGMNDTDTPLLEASKQDVTNYGAFAYSDTNINAHEQDDSSLQDDGLTMLEMMQALDNDGDAAVVPDDDAHDASTVESDVDTVYEQWLKSREDELARLLKPRPPQASSDSRRPGDAHVQDSDSVQSSNSVTSPVAADCLESTASVDLGFKDTRIIGRSAKTSGLQQQCGGCTSSDGTDTTKQANEAGATLVRQSN